MIDIKPIFSEIDGIDSFQRVDNTHILDLYIGIDNMSRYTLFLISENEPRQMFSSQIINVQIGQRNDKQWGISFSLINNRFEDIFCHFCSDIIESSRLLKSKKKGAEYIVSRYLRWQDMLSKYKGGLLSQSEIKGLIGELYFLKEYLIPLYGEEVAVNSWIGPEKADQDFVCENTWYEVKSTVSGAESIRISSIEQLDKQNDGRLVIAYLDKTSYADESKITLNSICNEVYDTLSTDLLKQKLSDILLNLGYYCRPEYDEFLYKFTKLDKYVVNKDFPCMRREPTSHAVINAKYELSVSFISNFLEKE